MSVKKSTMGGRAWSGWELVATFESGGERYVLLRDDAAALTAREGEILERASRGETNKVIAYELGLSHSTVRVLMARVCAKLGVRTRRAAIAAFHAGDRVMTSAHHDEHRSTPTSVVSDGREQEQVPVKAPPLKPARPRSKAPRRSPRRGRSSSDAICAPL